MTEMLQEISPVLSHPRYMDIRRVALDAWHRPEAFVDFPDTVRTAQAFRAPNREAGFDCAGDEETGLSHIGFQRISRENMEELFGPVREIGARESGRFPLYGRTQAGGRVNTTLSYEPVDSSEASRHDRQLLLKGRVVSLESGDTGVTMKVRSGTKWENMTWVPSYSVEFYGKPTALGEVIARYAYDCDGIGFRLNDSPQHEWDGIIQAFPGRFDPRRAWLRVSEENPSPWAIIKKETMSLNEQRLKDTIKVLFGATTTTTYTEPPRPLNGISPETRVKTDQISVAFGGISKDRMTRMFGDFEYPSESEVRPLKGVWRGHDIESPNVQYSFVGLTRDDLELSDLNWIASAQLRTNLNGEQHTRDWIEICRNPHSGGAPDTYSVVFQGERTTVNQALQTLITDWGDAAAKLGAIRW